MSDSAATTPPVTFTLNGASARVDDGISLLDALREELGCRSVKDGCSPQGQCGCCTVWVDGLPRVACVTPVRRIDGRTVTTLEGISTASRDRWADAFVAAGASQCGFCTPGILVRLAALEHAAAGRPPTRNDVEAALRAHLCRCTGWQTIVEAACDALGIGAPDTDDDPDGTARDPVLAAWRAETEGGTLQNTGRDVVLGGGGFADDGSPAEALVQLGAGVPPAEGFRAARAGAGRVQGRNSTVPLTHPVEVPAGDWAVTLQTTWVEPAYVEPDASWSRPGSVPATPLANGGAFGGKRHSQVPGQAQALSDRSGRAARVLWRREDVVRRGPKRPPLALGLRADGSGALRVGRTRGSEDLASLVGWLSECACDVSVEVVDVAGPPVSSALRGAVWAEVLAARAAIASISSRGNTESAAEKSGRAYVSVPGAGSAEVELRLGEGSRGRLHADVWAGTVLDRVTLRSYTLGAVHAALGQVWSEGIAVDEDGEPLDLTIRSFGILAARDMPDVTVDLHEDDEEGWPMNGSDAVFAATLASAWLAEGLPATWPTRRAVVRFPRRGVAPSGRREETL